METSFRHLGAAAVVVAAAGSSEMVELLVSRLALRECVAGTLFSVTLSPPPLSPTVTVLVAAGMVR